MEEARSPLAELLRINACERKLTHAEHDAAMELMADEDGGTCWLCGEPSVGGSGLCGGHAFYALATQK